MTLHFYSDYKSPDAEENRRMAMAKRTWQSQPWTELPIRDEELPRFFSERNRRLPYIKDLFDHANRKAQSSLDILVFTNSDLCVRSDCADQVREMLSLTDALYSRRMEFMHRFDAPIPDERIPSGILSEGTDLFAFRAFWWEQYRDQFPDLLIGRNFWDSCLIELINHTCDPRLTHLPWLTYHEVHHPMCMDPKNRWTIPSQLYVWQTALDWFKGRGAKASDYGIPAM